MHKTFQLIALAAVTLFATNTVSAQDRATTSIFDCSWEVWAADAEPQFRYFIDVLYEDGTGETLGPFSTYNDATWTLWIRTEHNTWPKPVAATNIYSQDVGPIWVFIAEFDTQAEAQEMAATLQGVGLLTEIRPKCTPRLFVSRYAQIVSNLQPVAGITATTSSGLKLSKKR